MRVFGGGILRRFCAFRPLQPPASIKPRIGISRAPAQIRTELQHFIENGRPQPAERNIDGHRDRRNPDAEVDVPAQHNLHDQRHGVHVDAAHQHGHEREAETEERARLDSPKRSFK